MKWQSHPPTGRGWLRDVRQNLFGSGAGVAAGIRRTVRCPVILGLGLAGASRAARSARLFLGLRICRRNGGLLLRRRFNLLRSRRCGLSGFGRIRSGILPTAERAVAVAFGRIAAGFGCFHQPRLVIGGRKVDHGSRTRHLATGAPVIPAILAAVVTTIVPTLVAPILCTVRLTVTTPILTAILSGIAFTTVLTVIALTVLLAVLAAGFLFGCHFTLRLGQHAGVMFGMLQEILGRHTVVRELRITGEKGVFLDDLLRRAAHLALGAGAVEDTIYDIAKAARTVRLGTRAGL